ncbi:class III extradiol dioxygenase subunit B-like domain-containing protein [Lentzea sp. HUAS12]|uniref:class III extradiol dioxygenase subunit B-like domain-containing protein n=1 Tax=Lentzea sp. HUAS12 TaxID=2951806 RepID=UPI00209CD0D2|nr:class III extradiol dioxygenase subunit B-like domain-containing protein [Lentzea sp. HUAS12]USX48195.1 class III extradiol dioxygenase subunit B-like domain-containing protein [Lentzea sp. HUAS12]
MITRAAVVPHPPLLVPELVSGAAAETEPVRAATLAAAGKLPGPWVAVAVDGSGPSTFVPPLSGTFLGYGVDVPVTLGGDLPPDATIPLPVLITAWLRERCGVEVSRVELVPHDLPTSDCVSFGQRLAAGAGDAGLLVLGDGSTRHGPRSPGSDDERSGPFDSAVHDLLAAADVDGLLGLDPGLARELGAQGRAAWQVLAGVPGPWRCSSAEFFAPFGVGYHVAVWERP